jgi:hypothetical protein
MGLATRVRRLSIPEGKVRNVFPRAHSCFIFYVFGAKLTVKMLRISRRSVYLTHTYRSSHGCYDHIIACVE